MASVHDFFLNTDLETAQQLTARLADKAGYRIETRPDGTTAAVRGSLGMTIAFGAMAGKKFYRVFPVAFFSAAPHIVVRVGGQSTGGKIIGGAAGIALSDNSLVDLTNAMGNGFTEAGVFAQVVTA